MSVLNQDLACLGKWLRNQEETHEPLIRFLVACLGMTTVCNTSSPKLSHVGATCRLWHGCSQFWGWPKLMLQQQKQQIPLEVPLPCLFWLSLTLLRQFKGCIGSMPSKHSRIVDKPLCLHYRNHLLHSQPFTPLWASWLHIGCFSQAAPLYLCMKWELLTWCKSRVGVFFHMFFS